MKVGRSVVVEGREEMVTLKMLLEAIDLVTAEAPDTARVKVFTDSMGSAASLGGFFNLALDGGDKAAKWFVGARWDEVVGQEKPAPKAEPAPEVKVEGAAK